MLVNKFILSCDTLRVSSFVRIFVLMFQLFFESHNPCQGMRQGNDVGTQYRSGIYYYTDDQKEKALAMKDAYEQVSGNDNLSYLVHIDKIISLSSA